MKTFDGKIAAITGAASGIGRALAIDLVGRGASVALSDVDEAGLAETVASCEGRGVKVSSTRVDVSSRAEVEAWAESVVAEHGGVDLVVNNAGVALAADIESMTYEDLEWLLGVNWWGVVHGTKAFLPHLRANGSGHIVNLSSVFGLISIPSQSAYNAAKFAVRGFTDALRMELEIAGGDVSCTTVHPGGIKTNIVRNARMYDSDIDAAGFDRMALTTPEKAAKHILAGVLANKRRVLVGPDAKVIDLLSRLPAGLYQRVVVSGERRRRRKSR